MLLVDDSLQILNYVNETFERLYHKNIIKRLAKLQVF